MLSILHWRCQHLLQMAQEIGWKSSFNTPLEMPTASLSARPGGLDSDLSILHWRCIGIVSSFIPYNLIINIFQYSIGDACIASVGGLGGVSTFQYSIGDAYQSRLTKRLWHRCTTFNTPLEMLAPAAAPVAPPTAAFQYSIGDAEPERKRRRLE